MKRKRHINKRLLRIVRSKQTPRLLIVLSLVVVGISMLVLSRAATPTASIEAEQGQLSSGASPLAMLDASGGNAVQFAGQSNGTTWWKPAANTRWQWVLEGGVSTDSTSMNRFDMYDIDLTEAIPSNMTQDITWPNGDSRTVSWPRGSNAAAFTALKAAGKKVVCYMDTGAFETYEPDSTYFPGKWGSSNTRPIAYNGPAAYANIDVIGGSSEDSAGGTFEGEFWLDIRESAWQYWTPIMWARLELAKRIGCDGVEGDQNNSYDNDPTFGINQTHSLRLYREVYYQTHLRGMTAISKNGIEITAEQVTNPTNIPRCQPNWCVPDGILNEECHQYSECAELDVARNKGLWVGQVEYRGNATSVCNDANTKGRMTMKKPENYAVTETILFACWEQ